MSESTKLKRNLAKSEVKFYGIKDTCCLDDNISFIDNDIRYGKCIVCNRTFLTQWKPSVTVTGFRSGMILSAICGYFIGILIGVLI